MRTRPMLVLWLLLGLLALVPPTWAVDSAQDADLTVDPVVRLFPVTVLGTDSAEALFVVTNRNATETRTLTAVDFGGPHADQFALGATNTCTGGTLAANGGSCTVGVKFHPTSRGSKGANLLIHSNDPESPTLTAFVANVESTADEAMRRMPPVLTALSIPEPMAPGGTYTFTWSLEGYHPDYTSNMVLFDCTGITDGSCGDSYSDATRLAESGNVDPASVTAGSWQFGGVDDQCFNYTWSLTVPPTRNDGSDWQVGSTDIVVRFYSKADVDQERNSSSVSLLVPGNLAGEYYDTTGRRIVKQIVR